MFDRRGRAPLMLSVSMSALFAAAGARAASCEDLAKLELADTTIESATSVPAGDHTTSDKATHAVRP